MLWAVVSYSLAFATGTTDQRHRSLLLRGSTRRKRHDSTLLFMSTPDVRIITEALISGAIVERIHFSAYVIFISLSSIVIYGPIAHWVWGGGWLATWRRSTSPAEPSFT